MLGLLRGSLPVREIAAELSLSPNTIKGYIRAIYCKLGVSTRAAAITPGARHRHFATPWPGAVA